MAILCLQMRLMCWDVDIVHRLDTELVDADYWSRLGVDLDFDPLLRGYLAYALERRHSSPPPTDLPMRKRICRTTADHEFRNQQIRLFQPTRFTYKV